jgi:serine/threonine protein kinase
LATTVEIATTPGVTITLMKRQGWAKADIKKLTSDGTNAILKDFADKTAFARWLGRRQISREIKALARLKGIPGVPSSIGEVGPCGLLLEMVTGEPVTRWRRRSRAEIEPMFIRLTRLVDAIHARGVAHLDLRKRDNVLISADGAPSIIDFNASIKLVPGGLAARLFFPMLRAIDRSALLKWKAHLLPEALSPEERGRLRRMTWLRRLWIFN